MVSKEGNMKILHTADWHMNDTLGRVDRKEDISKSLEQIAHHLEIENVDVMAVSGDLIERGSKERVIDALRDIERIFTPFLRKGGTIVAVTGNHDDEMLFTTLREAFNLVVAPGAGSDGLHNGGRLYLAPKPAMLTLQGRDGTPVQFALMPYPSGRCYLSGEQAHNWSSPDEKHRIIQQKYMQTLQALIEKANPRLPTVLVSHAYVRGVSVRKAYRLSEVDDVIFEAADVPTYWAYAAFGHIHQPQPAVAGAEYVRYAGSVERMDLGEAKDEKSVVLVDVGPSGRLGEPKTLPLIVTPIYHVEITDPDTQISQLRTNYPDADHALVSYTVHWEPGRHNLVTIRADIESTFPRWYERDDFIIGQERAGTATFLAKQTDNITETVRGYLRQQLDGHPRHDELMALAEELLAEEN
jgi:exonuclease SbcD